MGKGKHFADTFRISLSFVDFFSVLFVVTVFSCLATLPTRAEAGNVTVTVGVYENAPKVFTAESGKPAGIFIDIIEHIAELEEWHLRYVSGTWSENLDRLAKGEIDLMPDMAYSGNRRTQFSFHKVPVLSSWSQVYTPKGSGIRSVVDLNGKRIAVLERSVQQYAFIRLVESFGMKTTLISVPDYQTMFIASMSHELRTPLNSIIGFTGMTLQGLSGELNDEQKDNLARVYKSAKHLLALITDVIDISKIEAGRVEAFLEQVSLKDVVEEAVASVEPLAKEKGLVLELRIPADVILTTDRKRLLQCLLNILSNAVKFTESGKISVTSSESEGYLTITVNDTGIGIAEKDLPKLFEAFERLDSHMRVKAGGTGLGLYLTRKLATDILHGTVSVQSREGEGSTFSLRVPLNMEQAHAVTGKDKGGKG